MKKLKVRQQEILNFIYSEINVKGYPPTVREIGDNVGLASSSTVHGHLDRLEKKGIIRRDPTKPRAIEIINQSYLNEDVLVKHHMVNIPVIGKVTAGNPITAVENIEEYFQFSAQAVGSGELFMLRVEGDSMIDAGILDKDLVIVRQQEDANNGDIVVAMTSEGEATVKRFFKEKEHIRLQPENPSMMPIILSKVTLLGKIVGLFRWTN